MLNGPSDTFSQLVDREAGARALGALGLEPELDRPSVTLRTRVARQLVALPEAAGLSPARHSVRWYALVARRPIVGRTVVALLVARAAVWAIPGLLVVSSITNALESVLPEGAQVIVPLLAATALATTGIVRARARLREREVLQGLWWAEDLSHAVVASYPTVRARLAGRPLWKSVPIADLAPSLDELGAARASCARFPRLHLNSWLSSGRERVEVMWIARAARTLEIPFETFWDDTDLGHALLRMARLAHRRRLFVNARLPSRGPFR